MGLLSDMENNINKIIAFIFQVSGLVVEIVSVLKMQTNSIESYLGMILGVLMFIASYIKESNIN